MMPGPLRQHHVINQQVQIGFAHRNTIVTGEIDERF
jgi:hypothetical protein